MKNIMAYWAFTICTASPALATQNTSHVELSASPPSVEVVGEKTVFEGEEGRRSVLPKGTQFLVTPLESLSSKTQEVGTKIAIKVIFDVIRDGELYIPRGSKGFAEVTQVTGRGILGKSGKVEISFRELELENGIILSLTGGYRQNGERGGLNALRASAVVGPFAALVTGQSAEIKSGTQLIAVTDADLEIQ